ncbi:MAG: hypothetical protein ACI88H_001428, partial [Cocleimonas sp.]
RRIDAKTGAIRSLELKIRGEKKSEKW